MMWAIVFSLDKGARLRIYIRSPGLPCGNQDFNSFSPDAPTKPPPDKRTLEVNVVVPGVEASYGPE